jgi:arsenate reductase (glutaredoxin)
LITKMNISPRDLLRTGEPIYKELRLGERSLSGDEIIRLMIAHPELIQRPIVERGGRAVLGRPTANIKAVIDEE